MDHGLVQTGPLSKLGQNCMKYTESPIKFIAFLCIKDKESSGKPEDCFQSMPTLQPRILFTQNTSSTLLSRRPYSE